MFPEYFAAATGVVERTPIQPPQLDWLMLCGFLAALLSIFLLFEPRGGRGFVLGFAICCALLAVFALTIPRGWPLAMTQGAVAIATLRRWRRMCRIEDDAGHSTAPPERSQLAQSTAERIRPFFGSVGSEN